MFGKIVAVCFACFTLVLCVLADSAQADRQVSRSFSRSRGGGRQNVVFVERQRQNVVFVDPYAGQQNFIFRQNFSTGGCNNNIRGFSAPSSSFLFFR